MDALQAEAEATADEAFTEPWQSRAVATAVEAVRGFGIGWDEFRQRLMAAIDEDPHRPYYDSWVIALERLVRDYDDAG